MQSTPQDGQLMSKHRVLSFKPQLRLEWRGQDGQNETEQPDHSASLGDSITASTQIRFSVHTGALRGETGEIWMRTDKVARIGRVTWERASIAHRPVAQGQVARALDEPLS
jgi:hypothetical protein